MLMPFRVDPESFKSILHELFKAQEMKNHDELLKNWRNFGLLIYNGRSIEVSSLKKKICTLPPDLRKNWEIAFLKFPRLNCQNTEWNGELSIENFELINESPSIAIVQDDDSDKRFNIPLDEFSKVIKIKSGDCEILKFSFVSQSQMFQNKDKVAASHIPKEVTFEKIWDDRFLWLSKAENIHLVTVFDRFALQNALEIPSNQKSGIVRFIEFLNESATSKKYITIYTGWGHSKTHSDWAVDLKQKLLDRLVKQLARQNSFIKEITLEIFYDRDFKDNDGHDRHIRFDNYVWDIGKGISIFEGIKFSKELTTASFKNEVVQEYKQKEMNLKNLSNKRSHKTFKISSIGATEIR